MGGMLGADKWAWGWEVAK